MIGEECAMAGICSDCGGSSKVWTWEEIQRAKADIGMGEGDDFGDICYVCYKKVRQQLGSMRGATI